MANSKALIAVTGATGHIGRVASERLLEKGFRVRAVGRTAAKLESLKAKGAEPFQGSVEDSAAMAKAFEGAAAAFLLIPPHMTTTDLRGYQKKVAETMTKAAAKAGLKHVVVLSSIGGHLPGGTGPIAGLHDLEALASGLDASTIALRPPYFMENHLGAIGLIKGMGAYGSPMGSDYPFPQMATRDIGIFAADALADLDTKGHSVVELFGPRDLSLADSAKVLGAAIGKPDLKCVRFPYEDARKAMVGMGLSDSMAAGYIEMIQAFDQGKIRSTQSRGAANVGKTTLEEFARTTFRAAFEAQVAAAH